MSVRGWRASVAVIGLLATTWMLSELWTTRADSRPTSRHFSQQPLRSGVVGAGSCSARACHGAIEPPAEQAPWQNAYTTWRTKDRHGNAYEVLFDKRSQRIAQRLQAQTEHFLPAHKDARCLACHSIPAMAPYPGPLASGREDGVSCESCHGPAEKWLVPHTTRRWRELTWEEKQHEYGMMPMRSLTIRAQICASCHVGAPAEGGIPARDAYHDLLAAGHPRLSFEFGAFLANMPRHWVEKEPPSDFEARVWIIGQLKTADAALGLLESRANAVDRPWPEFAEYDCFACHHQLREEPGKTNWRQRFRDPNRPPGALSWGTWYFSMTRLLAAHPTQSNPIVASQLNGLERLMTQTHPDRAAVARQAREISQSLRDWLNRLEPARYDQQTVQQLFSLVVRDDRRRARSDWDSEAQRYLALVALGQTGGNDGIRPVMEDLFNQLKFPAGYDSPRDFEPEVIELQLRSIEQQLNH